MNSNPINTPIPERVFSCCGECGARGYMWIWKNRNYCYGCLPADIRKLADKYKFTVLIDPGHSINGIEVVEQMEVRQNGKLIPMLKPDVLIAEYEGYYYGVVECMRGKSSRSDFVSNGIIVKIGESYESTKTQVDYGEDDRFF